MFQDTGLTTPADSAIDPVAAWVDSIGGVGNAVNSTLSQQPALSTSYFGGRLVPEWDGADDVLSTPLVTIPEATIYFVHKLLSLTALTGEVKHSATASGVGTDGIVLYNSGSGGLIFGSPVTFPNWFTSVLSSYNAGDEIQHTMRWGSTFATCLHMSNNVTLGFGGLVGTYAAPASAMPLHIGAGYSTGRADGPIAEVVVFDTLHSVGEMHTVGDFLRHLTGLP